MLRQLFVLSAIVTLAKILEEIFVRGSKIQGRNKSSQHAGPRKMKTVLSLGVMSLLVLSFLIVPLPLTQKAFAASFGTPINISDTSTPSDDPQIAASGSNVFVTWSEALGGSSAIYFARSTNSGSSFGTPINISNTLDTLSESPQIAASGTNVFVTWVDGTGEDKDIFFAASTDSGSSFDDAINISNDAEESNSPQIVASDDNVFVTWVNGTAGSSQILLARSTDSGSSFETTINISNDAGTPADIPQIAASGSNVFVTWVGSLGGDNDILFAASTDSGSSFDDAINISNNGNSDDPQIAASDNNVALTWESGDFLTTEVLFARSTSSGSSFDDVINISNSFGASNSQKIAMSGSTIAVTWNDNTGGDDVLVSVSVDSGETFDSPIFIASSEVVSNPNVAISGSNIFVAWNAGGSGSNDDVYVSVSDDSGVSFGSPININNSSGADSSAPQMAISGSNVFVTWSDDTPGNFDIFISGGESDTSSPNHPPLSGLVSWYRAEGNADDAADSNDGTGSVTYGNGKMGQAFHFNGDGNQLEIAASSNLDVGTSDGLTISSWINPSDLSSRPLVEFNDGSFPGDGVHMWASYTDPGQLYANIKGTSGADHQIFSPVGILTPGTFQQVAVTYDKTSGVAKLYRNGVEVANQNLGIFTPQTTYDLYIGFRPSGGDYSGLIDEVLLYNRALAPTELQSIFDDGNAVLINSGDASTNSPTVTLTLTCQDAGSGCDTISVGFENVDADTTDGVDEIPIDVYSTTNPTAKTVNAKETGEGTGIFILELVLSSDGAGDSIQFTNGDTITATGTFFDSADGTKSVDATFTDAAGNSVLESDSIVLASSHATTLTLNPIRSVTTGTGFTVSGSLTDDVTGEPLSGELIYFSGTGATPSLHSVITGGVTFNASNIDIVNCPAATCEQDDVGIDADISVNKVLHLAVGGKITFPDGTVIAKLYFSDMGTTTFNYIVEEGDGDLQPEGQTSGIPSPNANTLVVDSGYDEGGVPVGIKEITITKVGGSTTTGSVGISAILTGNPDGLPVEHHQINFEEFDAGPRAFPFTVDPGQYFSTGFSQVTGAPALEVTAHFAGTEGGSFDYEPSDSLTQAYEAIPNTNPSGGQGGEGSQTIGSGSGSGLGGSVTIPSCTTDTDSDGICNTWEIAPGVGTSPFYPLHTASVQTDGIATTSQKDIFLEIDGMTGYCPTAADIDAVQAAFDAKGFKLHVVLSDCDIPVKDPLHVWTDADGASDNDFDNIKKTWFGTIAERTTAGGTLGSGAQYLKNKALVYHYGLFVKHINTGNTVCPATNPNGISGQSELGGNDFIVSLGCGFGAIDPQEIQGTLMHELGHNLGLRHGGDDDQNCKPNHISVMNYVRQLPWTYLSPTTTGTNPTEWSLTYSRQALISLDENSLTESNGLPIIVATWDNTVPGNTLAPGSTAFKIIWGKPATSPYIFTGSTGASVNWDQASGSSYAQDINQLTGVFGCTAATLTTSLTSVDEWSLLNSLNLNFRDGLTNLDGSPFNTFPDPDTFSERTPRQTENVIAGSNLVLDPIADAPAGGQITVTGILKDLSNNPLGGKIIAFSGNGAGGLPPSVTTGTDGRFSVVGTAPSTIGTNWEVQAHFAGNGQNGPSDIKTETYDTFQGTIGPNNISSNSGISIVPDVVASGNNVYVVWSDTSSTGNFDVRFKKSTNGGTSFGAIQNLSNNAGSSLTPRIAISGDDLTVIWSDTTGGTSGNFDILARSSGDGGDNWQPVKNISGNTGDSITPHLAVGGTNVYAIWSDKTGGTSGNFDIMYKKGTLNTGTGIVTWPTAAGTKLTNTAGESLTPAIGVSGTTVYAVWSDTTGGTSGKFDIFYKKSVNSGGTFDTSATNISSNSGDSLTPHLAMNPSGVHVVWSDTTGGTGGKFDILMKSSPLGGTFGTVNNVSSNAGHSLTPRIALSGSDIYVAWSDTTGGTSGKFDILIKKSHDGGAFGLVSNVSTNSGESITPSIAVSGSSVHLVWGDFTPGITGDIMYAMRTM